MNKKQIYATTEEKAGKLTAIASTEGKDRVGDVMKVSDWNFKSFKQNPVLQAGHDYRPEFTVGIAKNLRIEGKQILFEPVFHGFTQLAKEIKDMYENGILKAWSVGFIPAMAKGEKNELLEVSAVAVPANSECLTMMKGLSGKEQEKTEKEIGGWMKKEMTTEEVIETPEETVKEDATPEGEAKETSEVETPEVEEVVIPKEALEEGDKLTDEEKEEAAKDAEVVEDVVAVVEEKKVETKSPACRMEDESKDECVARKIPEILKENPDMDNDQATAIAHSMCDEKCKTEEKSVEVIEEKKEDSLKVSIELKTQELLKENPEMEESQAKAIAESLCEESKSEFTNFTIKGEVGDELERRENYKKKWANLDSVFKIVDAFVSSYLDEEIEVDEFKSLLKEMVGLLSKETKGKNIEVKEGRVLSKKNFKIVSEAKDALETLLEATKEEKPEKLKLGMKSNKKKLSNNDILIKTLQAIAKTSSKTLGNVKK